MLYLCAPVSLVYNHITGLLGNIMVDEHMDGVEVDGTRTEK